MLWPRLHHSRFNSEDYKRCCYQFCFGEAEGGEELGGWKLGGSPEGRESAGGVGARLGAWLTGLLKGIFRLIGDEA